MTAPMSDQQMMMLGEIKGLVKALQDGQDTLHARLETRMDAMDGRLRSVEQRAAVGGAISGGVMGVGMALIVESVQSLLRAAGKAP